jgi:uncharacterized Tic20 family protein
MPALSPTAQNFKKGDMLPSHGVTKKTIACTISLLLLPLQFDVLIIKNVSLLILPFYFLSLSRIITRNGRKYTMPRTGSCIN